MTGIRRLNHAVLFVSDLDRAVDFYCNLLGFEIISRETQLPAVFLRAAGSMNHHDLGLFGLGKGASPAQRRKVGLYHLAWQLNTLDELAELRTALILAGRHTGESSHGATLSVYGADPDENEFELMWMLPRTKWDEYENSAVVQQLDLDIELARWSGVETAAELGSTATE